MSKTNALATLRGNVVTMTKRRYTLAFVSVCLVASAQAAFACTHDNLMLSGQEISVQLCDLGRTQDPDDTQTIRISEQLRYSTHTLDHETITTVPNGSTASRAIDEIDLASLGLPQHLHITVRLAPSGPHLEHAIALPGPLILR